MKIINNLLNVISYIWELPQNLLGYCIYLKKKKDKTVFNVIKYKHRNIIRTNLGVSLGRYIFWTNEQIASVYIPNDINKYHEYGHSIQSMILGPTYLLVVGITSSCRALYAIAYSKKHKKQYENYYKGFPENWADSLGGIDSMKSIIVNDSKIRF
jgi:hypothetical protein